MADKSQRSRGLGRGLSALMADVTADSATGDSPRRADTQMPIEQVHPNPDQPRRSFDAAAMEELTASVREKGIIQPLIVRPTPGQDGQYQIVAGERRWRAAQAAQLHDVPVIVRSYDDTEVLEVAIIENIQRSDLNAIDEAQGYRQLMDRFDHTQEQLAQVLGKSRSHIANHLRLLTLPDVVQDHLASGALSAGHARTLIGRDDAADLAAEIIRRKLSVREAEKLARAGASPRAKSTSTGKPDKDADTLQIEAELSATLKMAVKIDHDTGGEGGRVSLRYRDLGQLDDLLRLLSGS